MREAIQSLSAIGVIELIPNRGARIRVPSDREVKEGYRVRAELEGQAAELATKFATQEQIDRLREAENMFQDAVMSAAGTGEGAEQARLR